MSHLYSTEHRCVVEMLKKLKEQGLGILPKKVKRICFKKSDIDC